MKLQFIPIIIEKNTFPVKEVPNISKNIVPGPRTLYDPMYKSVPSTCDEF